MKRQLQIIALCLVMYQFSNAQLIVTNASFPAVGDTLRTTTDAFPQDITISAPGTNLTWDLTGLVAGNITEDVIRSASEGAVADQFPTAELVSNYQGNAEGYVDVSSTEYKVIGYKGPDPGGLGLDLTVKFNPAAIERHAPLQFLNDYDTEAAVLLPLSTDLLPDSLLSQVPLLSGVDSIRIKIAITRSELVDGEGVIKIPGGNFDALRLKRREQRETRMEILNGFLGWFDVTDILGATGIGNFLGVDTVNTYTFFSNEAKEPIAVVNMDNSFTTVQSVTFKYINFVSGNDDIDINANTINVFPNPAKDNIVMNIKAQTNGDYALQIFDVLGKLVWKKSLKIDDNNFTIDTNISGFSSGNYFVQLLNKQNQTVARTTLNVMH